MESLTPRLDSDENFRGRVLRLVQSYVQTAMMALDWYVPAYDVCHDLLQAYSQLSRKDYVGLPKGHPRRYILPTSSTQIEMMTTYIAQVLFGDENPHKVNPGSPEDTASARAMNLLLKWNAEQQQEGIYQIGRMWIESALLYNRGVMYDYYDHIYKWQWESEEVPTGEIDPVTQQMITETRVRKVRKQVAAYNRIMLISPYDFYIDTLFPLHRAQEGRFAGHRVTLTWNELKNRSLLPVEDPRYVSPKTVEVLKKKPMKGILYPTPMSQIAGNDGNMSSYTAFQRNQLNNPLANRADNKDPGVVDCQEMWVRIIPKDYEIDDREYPVMFQVLMGNYTEVLSMNESTYEHDMFPYSVGEARPSPFYQFTPSWMMMLKPLQNYIDFLKDRHQEALSKVIGNVFIAKTNLIDIGDFEDPDKEGKFISVLPEAGNQPLNDIIRQVPLEDMTGNFINEMAGFIRISESTSGASQGLQGQVAKGDVTATEFQGALVMGQNRLNGIARLLSVQGIVPQTKRFVANFQQFYDGSLIRRVEGDNLIDTDSGQPQTITITPDVIQGTFDFPPHDGTIPSGDARKVAALSRSIETMRLFPQLFTPAPGNLDPRRIFMDLFRIAGMKPEEYRYRPGDIAALKAQMADQAAQQLAQATIAAEMGAAAGGGAPPSGGSGPGQPHGMIKMPGMRPGPPAVTEDTSRMESAEPPEVRPI